MLFAPASFVALALLALPSAAQQPVDGRTAFSGWRDQQGPGWSAEFDPRTGFVTSLYGGHTQARLHLFDDAMAFARAREHLRATAALTGVDEATLVDDRALFLPLSNAGSSDKYTVRLSQMVGGVPVVYGSVNVLMDLEGRVLSIESSAIPATQTVRTQALSSGETAASVALSTFASIAGMPGTLSGVPRLVLDTLTVDGELQAVLAWEVCVFSEANGGVPRGLCLRIADDTLRLTSREELVHTCDVTGTVFTRLTPGVLPDIAVNPTTQLPLAHVQVNSPQGNAITDANGNFNIIGASAPLAVTVKYDGPFTTTVNSAGAAYVLAANLPTGAGNSMVMNSPAAALVTGEANSAYWIGRLRDWVRAVNPADATADFDALSNVNLAQTCNAYFAGSSVNFFQAGGGCVNTSYSTVVAHEMGHWLNVRYNSGNGPDGFGEGNADNYATFLTDQPIVGENFFTNGGIIRSGLNGTTFCGDAAPACHGEVHADGEVLMGAMWKLRARLKNTLGASAGSAAADSLFSAWMNAYDDQQIKTIVRTHWLVLDDDDGNIDNGTPNFASIDLGFRDQGFPPYPLIALSIVGMTQLPNTVNEVGPYFVSANVTANLAPPLQTPQFFWRVNGGAFTAVPMTPQGGSLWQAAIPGQISPAKVEYYIRAQDNVGATGFAPAGAPATLQRFIVGDERVYFNEPFDGGFSLWQTGATSGVNDWQFQTPMGKGGDPLAPRTGTRCWGTDQGTGTADGLYSNNSSSWFQSPPINLSTCAKPRLRLQRWLTIESALNDSARILVNGQVVWQHTGNTDLLDLGWTEQEFDIQAIAAGNPATVIRFELTTNGQIQKGGWNVDDVQVVSVEAVGQGCVDPFNYCTAKLTSVGTTPFLETKGSTSVSLANLKVELHAATYNKAGVLFHSASGPNAAPFNGGTLCVLPPITRDFPFLTDPVGWAQVPYALPASAIGQTWYIQGWFRDPPSIGGVGLSDALQVRVCP